MTWNCSPSSGADEPGTGTPGLGERARPAGWSVWGQRRTRGFYSWTERKAAFRHGGMGATQERAASGRDWGR